jgi:hypothetical protein
MDLTRAAFWILLIIIVGTIFIERIPFYGIEGFETSIGSTPFWTKYLPRRGDVGPELEMGGLVCDKRYFSGYVDIQRFGVKHDFCRMVEQSEKKFFACALAGTENLSSTSFRTPYVDQGFMLSRDDYMRDTTGNGRDDYCRILKSADGTFEAKCNVADDTEFSSKLTIDNSPPQEIEMLLSFYASCVFWLRLRDDMVDYAQNLYVNNAGSVTVDETEPNPPVTQGLAFNGINQFLRIGDDRQLGFGREVPLRSVRAMCFWVKFDQFTNNAHIFDFGNGPGIDNVFMGIIGHGNAGSESFKNGGNGGLLCGQESTVPQAPSGAQDVPDMTPQRLMKTTDANVEEWSCTGFSVVPRDLESTIPKDAESGIAVTADLLYEVWLSNQRKMQIKIPMFFTRGEWVHIAITAKTNDAFRPTLFIYKNGEKVYTQPDGWLPQNSSTKKNYIGKSNWADQTSQFGNRDELFKGSLFDFRGYTGVLSEKVIRDSVKWGKTMLGL